MLTRVGGGQTFNYSYDAENHLTSVSGSATATMVYDGDGNRVKSTIGGTTTVYIGNYPSPLLRAGFEWTGSASTLVKYFYAGTNRIAMKKGSTVYYTFGDHLGSTAITASSAGAKLGELRYKPWGENRYTWGTTYTSRQFTGQVNESSLGLYFFNARWYDAALGRFLQADSLIPEPGNPQAWDRYAYSYGNPVKYIDPTGHRTCTEKQAASGDETCDQNITPGIDRIIHRVPLGSFAAAKPIEPKDQLPAENPVPITNPGEWGLQAIGALEGILPPPILQGYVFTYLTYSEYGNGSVDNFSISVVNNSTQNVYFKFVSYSTKRWDEDYRNDLACCAECGVFAVYSNTSDYLATVEPFSSSDVNLSTYPVNPAVSLAPDLGYPPFSANINVTLKGYFYTNTAGGFTKIQLEKTIWAPRLGW
jgi:RHS repeat-associated protein